MALDIKDGNEVLKEMFGTQDENGLISLIATSREMALAVSMGQIDGFEFVNKYGQNLTITTVTDPEDIWEGGGTYTFDAFGTAPTVSIASNSASDTGVVRVQGLDINGDFVSQDITLNGTSRVAFTTGLWRVNRMINKSSSSLVGTVFCYTGTGGVPSIGDSEVRALIDNGNNQTLMGVYTIPNQKVGFFMKGQAGMQITTGAFSGDEYARMYVQSSDKDMPFGVRDSFSLLSRGNSPQVDERFFPDPISGLADIKFTCSEVSETLGIWCKFSILLVDESYFPDAYLQAIEQPGY